MQLGEYRMSNPYNEVWKERFENQLKVEQDKYSSPRINILTDTIDEEPNWLHDFPEELSSAIRLREAIGRVAPSESDNLVGIQSIELTKDLAPLDSGVMQDVIVTQFKDDPTRYLWPTVLAFDDIAPANGKLDPVLLKRLETGDASVPPIVGRWNDDGLFEMEKASLTLYTSQVAAGLRYFNSMVSLSLASAPERELTEIESWGYAQAVRNAWENQYRQVFPEASAATDYLLALRYTRKENIGSERDAVSKAWKSYRDAYGREERAFSLHWSKLSDGARVKLASELLSWNTVSVAGEQHKDRVKNDQFYRLAAELLARDIYRLRYGQVLVYLAGSIDGVSQSNSDSIGREVWLRGNDISSSDLRKAVKVVTDSIASTMGMLR